MLGYGTRWQRCCNDDVAFMNVWEKQLAGGRVEGRRDSPEPLKEPDGSMGPDERESVGGF